MGPQTEDEAFELILVVLVPCIVSVSCLLCCARIFYVYYSYRRERIHRLPVRRRRVRRRDTIYEHPTISVINPPPNYDQILKQSTDVPPPAYSVQPTPTTSETDSSLPPHYTPTENDSR
ncbi:hypothetical protein PRIPAC_93118 [Pristionchus pacificus]|nr:hypothetical protein PRIPAC_93118 [Pristionchus pacificus]